MVKKIDSKVMPFELNDDSHKRVLDLHIEGIGRQITALFPERATESEQKALVATFQQAVVREYSSVLAEKFAAEDGDTSAVMSPVERQAFRVYVRETLADVPRESDHQAWLDVIQHVNWDFPRDTDVVRRSALYTYISSELLAYLQKQQNNGINVVLEADLKLALLMVEGISRPVMRETVQRLGINSKNLGTGSERLQQVVKILKHALDIELTETSKGVRFSLGTNRRGADPLANMQIKIEQLDDVLTKLPSLRVIDPRTTRIEDRPFLHDKPMDVARRMIADLLAVDAEAVLSDIDELHRGNYKHIEDSRRAAILLAEYIDKNGSDNKPDKHYVSPAEIYDVLFAKRVQDPILAAWATKVLNEYDAQKAQSPAAIGLAEALEKSTVPLKSQKGLTASSKIFAAITSSGRPIYTLEDIACAMIPDGVERTTGLLAENKKFALQMIHGRLEATDLWSKNKAKGDAGFTPKAVYVAFCNALAIDPYSLIGPTIQEMAPVTPITTARPMLLLLLLPDQPMKWLLVPRHLSMKAKCTAR